MEAIIQTDNSGFVTQWSAEAEKLFGYTSREVTGWSIDTFVHSIEKLDSNKRMSLVLDNIIEKVSEGKDPMKFSTINLRSDLKAFNDTVLLEPVEGGTRGIVTETETEQIVKEYNALVDMVKGSEAAVLSRDGRLIAVNAKFALFAKTNRMRLLNRMGSMFIKDAKYYDLSEEFDDLLDGFFVFR